MQPSPELALLPDLSRVDFSGQRQAAVARSRARAQQRSQQRAVAAQPILHDEREPAGIAGNNDSVAIAERIPGFGTARNRNPKARVLGQLSNQTVAPATLAPVAEDNGSIPLAGVTGIAGTRRAVRTTGTIGDGPHGSAGSGSSDFDFYKLTGVPAGLTLTADTDTGGSGMDTVLAVYDAAGELVAVNDDAAPPDFDSTVSLRIETAGDYYVMVSGFGFGTVFPDDPFDSGSGFGAGAEGAFTLTITVALADADHYGVNLVAGDVVAASVTGATRLQVFENSGLLVHGSTQDASALYPITSPLPGGGDAVVEHVAKRNGRYVVAVDSGAGRYDMTLEVYRPGSELDARGAVQTIFVDFNGARVNTAVFGGPGVRQLSPLAGFLGGWGLRANQENALIDRIMATVSENIERDLAARGTNPNLRVRLLNSRDHADPFGQPNVSRLIVGGTIAESGVDTIGIAQSIDPGNYGHEETALILLDLLSEAAGESYSLNSYVTSASNKVRFVGTAVGNVVSHEAGHYLGSWHVDQFNDTPSIMDQGGNFSVLYGVGPDDVGGTGDDVDVDFNVDTFNPGEGFTGVEDTLNRSAWALARGNG